jgi:GxxExxY protein
VAFIETDPFSRRVIGCAIEVHRTLGPGLLESIYEACLCLKLASAGLAFTRQPPLPVTYKGQPVDCAFKSDIVVEQTVLMEIKSVETLLPVHEAQLLTYLKVSGLRVGLRLNLNAPRMMDGVRRRLL